MTMNVGYPDGRYDSGSDVSARNSESATHPDLNTGPGREVDVGLDADEDAGSRSGLPCTMMVVYRPEMHDDTPGNEHGSLSSIVIPPAQDLVGLGGGVDLRETTILVAGNTRGGEASQPRGTSTRSKSSSNAKSCPDSYLPNALPGVCLAKVPATRNTRNR